MGDGPRLTRTGNSISIGPREPYADLLDALSAYSLRFGIIDRKNLQKLAWFLGEAGETEACCRIMEHAAEPAPRHFMYGGPF